MADEAQRPRATRIRRTRIGERLAGFIYGTIIVLMMLFRPVGLIPERRRKRELEEGPSGPADEPLYDAREQDEPEGTKA